MEMQLYSDRMQWVQQLQKASDALHYFETTGMQQAETIAAYAQQSFQKGAIDYLQWNLLMNQVVQIRLGYLEAKKNYNQSAIQLSYYLAK
jgi:cobalt-zinc-cadmium resistance protein CzcA